MPRFYFHLSTPQGRELDELGMSCRSADHAMVDAWRAIGEINLDLMRQGRASTGHRFEVCDTEGRLVFELAFSDVLAPTKHRAALDQDVLRTRTKETLVRNQRLRTEMAIALADLQATVAATQALLALRP